MVEQAHQQTITGVSDAALGYFYGQNLLSDQLSVIICRSAEQCQQLASELAFFAPALPIYLFPAWDVQPFDRLNPSSAVESERLKTIAAVKGGAAGVVLTTVNALSIKVAADLPTPLTLTAGSVVDRGALLTHFTCCGYLNVGTVMEPGEFAVRGSIVDFFCPTAAAPIRLDFFDDELETIKTFDTVSQRTGADQPTITVAPTTAILLDDETIATFRTGYRAAFPNGQKDALYNAISAGRTYDGMAHYLPLFFEQPLVNFLRLLPENSKLFKRDLTDQALAARWQEITECYDTRLKHDDSGDSEPYRLLKRELLYSDDREIAALLSTHAVTTLTEFDSPDVTGISELPSLALSLAGERGHARVQKALALVKEALLARKRVLISALSPSSLLRLEKLIQEQIGAPQTTVKSFAEIPKKHGIYLTCATLSWGFYSDHLLVITEQDIFGEKTGLTPRKRRRSPEEVMAHFNAMEPGSFVVHEAHGIGRFEQLETMTVAGESHDFALVTYDGDDKLYVPVVNLDVLSKYSGDPDTTKRDKLGGSAWQARKAKVKKDLLAMAGELLQVAAAREVKKGHVYSKPDGLYDEFCAGFPYIPTEEQQKAVADVEQDLFSDRLMDRLVVGDVGFGKTEVALRAAFLAAADGKQVAVIVPTTLLARQHYENFTKRFDGFPLKVGLLSRLVTGKQKKATLDGLKNGSVDIVIGTHALLSDNITFNDLGLVIVDEEQRFGVAHKEKLKALKATVDVLTLTATPIPRTLQMSLSGLRTLSMITTAPVDRLAVRTYVMQLDRKTIREAILREMFRGGQVFVVTPRVAGIEALAGLIAELVPEAKVRVAHGQMPKDALDRTMTAFYDNEFQVLVATTIIESGIDVPRANTLIVHQAHKFGLAQLYQIRGRVGRSKTRAYAYFLLPHGVVAESSLKRLKILQRLDGMGAGFTLASYDMDMRGAGNVLGTEQSGQIKEVGFALYNKMLHEAVALVRDKQQNSGDQASAASEFNTTLNLGLSYLIPADYVRDLGTRMALYRRLSELDDKAAVADMADELVDRFGPLPEAVRALLAVVRLKQSCRRLNIERLDVGPKGAVITFHRKTFPNPMGLMQYINENPGFVSLKPDQKVVLHYPVGEGLKRLEMVGKVLGSLEKLLEVS